MSLSPTTTWFVFIILIVAYLAYDTRSLSKKVFCTFRGRDGTRLTKWATMTQGRILHDNGWYYVRPDRTYQALYTGGLHFLIPTWIRCSDYKWDSPQPLDPKTWNNDYETPEQRRQLDKEEDIRALHEGNRKAQGAMKQGALSNFMPIIIVIGFVAVGFVIYMVSKKIDNVGFALNVVQAELAKLMAR